MGENPQPTFWLKSKSSDDGLGKFLPRTPGSPASDRNSHPPWLPLWVTLPVCFPGSIALGLPEEPGEDARLGQRSTGWGSRTATTLLRTVLEIDGVGEIVALQFRDPGLTARRKLVEDLIGLLNIEKRS